MTPSQAVSHVVRENRNPCWECVVNVALPDTSASACVLQIALVDERNGDNSIFQVAVLPLQVRRLWLSNGLIFSCGRHSSRV